MEGQKTALNHTEAEAQNTVHRGHYKDKGIAVFTSGGDAQGIVLPEFFELLLILYSFLK